MLIEGAIPTLGAFVFSILIVILKKILMKEAIYRENEINLLLEALRKKWLALLY